MSDALRGPVAGSNGQLSLEQERHTLDEPLLTPAEAAKLLSVRVSWIYEAVRAGRLPCVRIGRHIRFLRSDLEAFVREQRCSTR
jgi:excisionase family DNA binding protein